MPRDSHQLTAQGDHDAHGAAHKRSAKRVLEQLTGGDGEREQRCWRTTLAVLRERGAENGLASYLAEVQERLRPGPLQRPP